MKKIVVLISGRGSNLAALMEACANQIIAGQIIAVISNRSDAGGLTFAQAHGIPTQVIDHRLFASRADFDAALATALQALNPDLVLLAGFMRVLTPKFVGLFAGRMLNIHPSLLPAFPGLNTHARALAAGVPRHGASVHFVTQELDAGPILMQVSVAVLPNDTVEVLQARVLREEHRLYAEAVRCFCADEVEFREGQILWLGKPLATPLQLSPWSTQDGLLPTDTMGTGT